MAVVIPHWLLAGFTKEVAVAILGGIATYMTVQSHDFITNYRNKKRFPVAGEYVTEYEDETQSGTKLFFASASLKQKGLHVRGTTRFSNKRWILEGIIHHDGYLSGIYYADNPYDRGVGNFFLNIYPTGDLEGLWSGYDPENGKIHSGSYIFRKNIPVTVSKIKKDTAGQAMSIAEQQLGDSYIQENDFLGSDTISLCAVRGKDMVGFCIGKILEKDQFTSLHPVVSASLTRPFAYIDRLGLVASVATDPAYEGRGIASTLVRACLDAMDSAGLSLVCSIGWKSGGSVHVGGILERFSFRPIQEFPDFWKEDSLAKGYHCPICGEPPCLCSAVVYIRHAPIPSAENDIPTFKPTRQKP